MLYFNSSWDLTFLRLRLWAWKILKALFVDEEMQMRRFPGFFFFNSSILTFISTQKTRLSGSLFFRILFCKFNLSNHQTHFLKFFFLFTLRNLYQYPTKYLVLISSSSHYYIMFILQTKRSRNFLILSLFENLTFVSHENAARQVVGFY